MVNLKLNQDKKIEEIELNIIIRFTNGLFYRNLLLRTI